MVTGAVISPAPLLFVVVMADPAASTSESKKWCMPKASGLGSTIPGVLADTMSSKAWTTFSIVTDWLGSTAGPGGRAGSIETSIPMNSLRISLRSVLLIPRSLPMKGRSASNTKKTSPMSRSASGVLHSPLPVCEATIEKMGHRWPAPEVTTTRAGRFVQPSTWSRAAFFH